MKAVLIHVSDSGRFYGEDIVDIYDNREDARRYCAGSASNDEVQINKIVEVDLSRSEITELELQLDNFNKLQLVEKGRNVI